jgi:serine/threonine-protein kinase
VACLDDETVLAYAGRRLSPDALGRADAHLVGCASCRMVVAEAAKYMYEGGAEEPRAEPGAGDHADAAGAGAHPGWAVSRLAPGTAIGRYEIEAFVGAGAVGTVYRARDPQLKRHVALKLLDADAAPERSLREAEALARLQHPNVIAVYDAGTHGDGAAARVYIVMELVVGETLAAWLSGAERPWRQIVRAFVDAGRGLGAAHEAGLVHRDVKPENVLVGRDGRVRVTDFGLARPAAAAEPGAAPPAAPGAAAGDASGPAPAGGRVTTAAGTPLYMAPEQLRGEPATPRSAQFAFCVSLFAALHGRRPGGSDDLLARAAGKETFAAGATAAGSPLPPALTDVLRRGLAPRPDDRFPSMADVCDALEAALAERGRPSPRLRRAAWAAAALGAAGAVVAAGALGRRPACGDGDLRPQVEECDDGNTRDGDGCTSACLRCDENATSFAGPDGHCYTWHERPAPWHAALASCRAGGAELATFSRGSEVEIVRDRLPAGRTAASWIGLGPRPAGAAAGQLSWVTGEPLGFAVWGAGEPARTTGVCVRRLPVEGPGAGTASPANRSAELGAWAAGDCGEALPFVCERAGWRVREETGHAYRLFGARVSWAEAARACAARGAHLVTITDAEEQAFVAALTTLAAWIGATEPSPAEGLRWVTGEPFAYRRFSPGDPDRYDGGGCVVLRPDDLWYDRNCHTLPYAYVCEIE